MVTRREFYGNLSLVRKYSNLSWLKYSCKSQYYPFYLVRELYEKAHHWQLEGSLDLEIPSKLKFSRVYPRKYIIKIFSELGFTVTRYTNEYGKTIINIIDSNS